MHPCVLTPQHYHWYAPIRFVFPEGSELSGPYSRQQTDEPSLLGTAPVISAWRRLMLCGVKNSGPLITIRSHDTWIRKLIWYPQYNSSHACPRRCPTRTPLAKPCSSFINARKLAPASEEGPTRHCTPNFIIYLLYDGSSSCTLWILNKHKYVNQQWRSYRLLPLFTPKRSAWPLYIGAILCSSSSKPLQCMINWIRHIVK